MVLAAAYASRFIGELARSPQRVGPSLGGRVDLTPVVDAASQIAVIGIGFRHCLQYSGGLEKTSASNKKWKSSGDAPAGRAPGSLLWYVFARLCVAGASVPACQST